MSQKPFELLDLTAQYVKHDVPLFAHDHPSEPDGINAGVKAIEAALKAFDLDDYGLGGGGTARVVIPAATSLTLTAEQCPGDTVIIVQADNVVVSLPDFASLPVGVEIMLVNPDAHNAPTLQDIGSSFIFPPAFGGGGYEKPDTVTQSGSIFGGEHIRIGKYVTSFTNWCVLSWTGQWFSMG